MIAIENVVKVYGERRVVDGITMDIPKGRIFGLLGPNGAGKTTLLRMIMGLVKPDGGRVRLFGDQQPGSDGAARRIGYMPQELALYPGLSVLENILFFGRLYGVPEAELRRRARTTLEQVELADRQDSLVGTLSGGMMRRAMLASAVVHQPELLILDEPTAGVDPLLRLKFWQWFNDLADGGVTLLITTHHISEADRSQEVVFYRLGKIIRRGTPQELLKHYQTTDLEHAFVKATEETGGNNA